MPGWFVNQLRAMELIYDRHYRIEAEFPGRPATLLCSWVDPDAASSRCAMGQPSILQTLTASSGDDPPSDCPNEDNAALHFTRLYAGRLLYCTDTHAWYEWNGTAWRQNKTGLVFHLARELARDLGRGQKEGRQIAMGKTSFAQGIECFAQADPAFVTSLDQWDYDPFLLGTPGGTVDLRNGVLREARPNDRITKLAACAPAETADCPLWLEFLREATGDDPDLVHFLRQWSGYSLTGDTREHTLVFIFGPGGNGKSVFVNVLSRILGEYAVVAAMDTFTAARGDRHPTDLAMLRGARLVCASETDEGQAWAESRIKALTGADPIAARFMRQDFFTFRPEFKLLVVGNHTPLLRNVDDAIRRRFLIVPFICKPSNPDPLLEDKLMSEAPAILRWMIEGCLDWQVHGLTRPAQALAATRDYFDGQDVVAEWAAETLEIDPDNDHLWESSAALFASWQGFARGAGEPPGTRKSFSGHLQRLGLRAAKKFEKRGYCGVRIKQSHFFGHDGD